MAVTIMSSASLDLGTVHAVSTKRLLQLRVDVVINASRQNPSPSAADCVALTREALELKPWICRGSGLCLVVDFSVNDKPLSSDALEELRNALVGAEAGVKLRETRCPRTNNVQMWDQLELSANIPALSGQQNPRGDIVIELRHAQDDRNRKKTLHRLLHNVPHADMKPPDGVDVYGLERVHMNLFVQPWNPRKRKGDFDDLFQFPEPDASLNLDNVFLRHHQRGVSYLPDDTSYSSWADMLDETSDVDPSVPYAFDYTSIDDATSEMLESPIAEDAMLLEKNDEMTDHLEVPLPPPSLNDEFTPSQASNESVPASTDLSRSTQENTVTSSNLCELLDAALRLAISSRPAKLGSGIKVKSTSLQPRLAELVPSIFSPGYIAAVAQRAVFVPTIAHALSHSIFKDAQSASLKQKLEELTGLTSTGGIPQAKDLGSKEVGQVVAMKTWKLLQQQVFDPKAARKLKPVSLTAYDDGLPSIKADKLLDDANPNADEESGEDDHLFDDAANSALDFALMSNPVLNSQDDQITEDLFTEMDGLDWDDDALLEERAQASDAELNCIW